jgi:hypothetical protein
VRVYGVGVDEVGIEERQLAMEEGPTTRLTHLLSDGRPSPLPPLLPPRGVIVVRKTKQCEPLEVDALYKGDEGMSINATKTGIERR